MDPNANLEEMRELSKKILVTQDRMELAEMADRLAELVQSMDGWLTAGGFLPNAWKRD